VMSGRLFFFSSRRRHTRLQGDWSSDVCSSDLNIIVALRPGSVTNSGNQRALENMLSQATESLQDDPPNFNKARKKLVDAIERTDGCVLRGTPDLTGGGSMPKADTVNNCADQGLIYPLLDDALNVISP